MSGINFGEVIGLIIVGAIAFRGACSLVYIHTEEESALLFEIPPGFWEWNGLLMILTRFYMFAALPLAFANGFLLEFSWLEAFIVAIGTWLAMLLFNLILRFNSAIQFMLFGLVNVIWLITNVFRGIPN